MYLGVQTILFGFLYTQCRVHEKAQRQHNQALISSQQLMLRHSLVQNAELKKRLSQIQALSSGLDSTHNIPPPVLTTPQAHTPSFSQLYGSASGPRYGGKSLARFDSFMSVRSSFSDKFFDAMDDVSWSK